jgi:hypothetical protein
MFANGLSTHSEAYGPAPTEDVDAEDIPRGSSKRLLDTTA